MWLGAIAIIIILAAPLAWSLAGLLLIIFWPLTVSAMAFVSLTAAAIRVASRRQRTKHNRSAAPG